MLSFPTKHCKVYKNKFKHKRQKKDSDFCLSLLYGSPNWARTSDIMINSHALYRLSYGGLCFVKSVAAHICILDPTKIKKCWQCPIFPGRFQPSIFGADELNFRVRYGYGWTLIAIITNSMSAPPYFPGSLPTKYLRHRRA